MYEIYGKDDCGYCIKAKDVLEKLNLPTKYYELNADYTVEQFAKKFSGIKTVPMVLCNGSRIGGYEQLLQHLENEGMIND